MAVNGSGLTHRASGIAPSERSSSRDEAPEPRSFLAAESSRISEEAQQLQKLQQLQATDPEKFRKVASHISIALAAASKSQPGGESLRLNRLSDAFNPAAVASAPALPATATQHRFTKAYADQQRIEAGGDIEHIIGEALKQA